MFAFDVTKWVPKFILQDMNGYAIAKAIEVSMQIMNDTIRRGVDRVSDYDKMPEWRLDELAWEYLMDWYDYNGNLDTKREQIKNSFNVQRHLGTKSAVLNEITVFYPGANVYEWFDYGGLPYHFKVEIQADTAETDTLSASEIYRRISERVRYNKNCRSVLDAINYFDENNDAMIHSGAAFAGCSIVDSCPAV